MKYLLILLMQVSCYCANAQCTFGLDMGASFNTTVYHENANNGEYRYFHAKVMPTFNVYAYTDISQSINIGAFVRFIGYNVTSKVTELGSGPAGYNKYSSDAYKSYYCFIGPLINIEIDKKKYFSLSFIPGVGFPIYGTETGYFINNIKNDTLNNSNQYIKKEELTFEVDLKYRYSIKKSLSVNAQIGYILGNSLSKFEEIAASRGLIQVGLEYRIKPKASKATIK